MYIWTAINIDHYLKDVRALLVSLSNTLNSDNSALTLPLHVSLRMSFHCDDSQYEEIYDYIKQYFKSLSSFSIKINEVQEIDGIVWIRMESNPQLVQIHEWLVSSLSKKFGIAVHPFDTSFAYHSTLFMDKDQTKVHKVYTQINSQHIPSSFQADHFLIGVSENGKAGEYRVAEEIVL